MTATAILVESLSKQYRTGTTGYGTLREDLGSWWARLRGKEDPNSKLGGGPDGSTAGRGSRRFWALKDVSFSVHTGEVVGVIGRNGAGKSTLLKIMSRVTSPTRGCVKLRGRVASLLEVGTGFHPDLSGRENVFLNGAMLGMTRAEISRKFDDIVSFAEIERFIETPVKRYSSGMYVRLAFAVAAHLEPEILLVDEVLAVGDAAFQARCLGKMEEVSRAGRTILFVSHNLQAIKDLCTRSVLLADGELKADGPSDEVIDGYLATATATARASNWRAEPGLGRDGVWLEAMAVYPADQDRSDERTGETVLRTDRDIVVAMDLKLEKVPVGLCVGFDLMRPTGAIVFRSYQTDLEPSKTPKLRAGPSRLKCTIERGLLGGGTYLISPRIGIHNQEWLVHEDGLISFRSVISHGRSPFWNCLTEQTRPGSVSPILKWSFE